jgi:hypothetical protein
MHRLLCAAGSLIGQECDNRQLAANSNADDRAMPNQPDSNANEAAFAQFTATYGYNYRTPEEYRFRSAVWQKKHNEVEAINAEEGNSFKLADNKFSSWTEEEFANLLALDKGRLTARGGKGDKGGRVKPTCGTRKTPPCPPPVDDEVYVDWRTSGALNDMKDQGGCGSCWSFAATTPMESAHFINTGTLLHLSEQQLVDCDPRSSGCNGGWHDYAMMYAETKPLALAGDYPYRGIDQTCQDSQHTGVVRSTGHVTVRAGSVSALEEQIAIGPVGIALAAGNTYFGNYASGVMDDARCGSSLDHAITAIGYGIEGGKKYYIVQNQWGTGWGDNGYMKLGAVDGTGICGVQQYSYRPEVEAV